MEKTDVITLENNEEYSVINTVSHNDIKYLLLSDVSNSKDICIRKVVTDHAKEYISRLEESELKLILNLFVKENQDIAQG